MTGTLNTTQVATDDIRTAEIDAMVDTAAAAAREFRELDQDQVDRIVEVMDEALSYETKQNG